MTDKLSQADIYAMFERVGVSPIERDKEELRDLMTPPRPCDGKEVVYRTVLSNGTGKSMRGGTGAELESDSY
jgi:hypothetical protein